MNKQTGIKIFILVGLFITIIGLCIHVYCPTELDSAHFYLESGQVYTKQFELDKSSIDIAYQLHLRVNFPPNYNGTTYSAPNATVLLLNETEYLKFSETAFDHEELKPIITMTMLNDPSEIILKLEAFYQFPTTETVDVYFIISSRQTEPLRGNYYIGITPPTYYLGILVVFVGLFIVFLTLIYWFSDWKRYLTVGIGINLIIFLFRIITIGQYNSIGMQFSYFGDLIHPEMYNDFEFWYMSRVDPFLQGASPYGNQFTPELNGVFHYQMPPLFIITLGLFQLIPLLPGWKIAIPIFLSHIATGILVYLIINNVLGYQESSASKAMLFYYLNPISLIFASFCLFNPPSFVFFLLLAMYLITTDKKEFRISNRDITSYDIALIFLAISTMYKQFAAAFFPLVIIAIIKQRDLTDRNSIFKALFRYSTIYFMIILIVVLPFIVVDFSAFFHSTFLTTTSFGIWWTKNINYSSPVNFNTFFVILGLPGIITDIIGFMIVYWILLGASATLIYLIFLFDVNKLKFRKNSLKESLFFWVLILAICTQLFYPRGSFKFYLILLVPFLSLNMIVRQRFTSNIQIEKDMDNFLVNKWFRSADFIGNFLFLAIILLINRYVYFVLLLGWLVYLIVMKNQSDRKENILNEEISNMKTNHSISENP